MHKTLQKSRFFAALAAAALLTLYVAAAQAETFIDSAQRRVELPAKVDKVLPAGPPAAVVLSTLAPDKLLGWVRVPDEEAQAYLPPRLRKLQALGRITGRNAVDAAAIKALGADLIVDFGDVNASYTELANRTQAATGIPYILIDGTLKATPAAYRSLGKIVQAEPRAEMLATRSQALLDEVSAKVAAAPASARKSVYFARGSDGNETYGAGAFTDEMVTPAGGTNVAETWGRGNLKDIATDKVREANPDIVIVLDPYFLEVIARSPTWKQVPAIAAGRVHVAPRHSFGWLDEPPSVNRLIGLRWLAGMLHPDSFSGNLRDTVRDFYRTFYQVDLNAALLDKLLANSQPAKR
jgi:iron complex transport system substrate-binding protein